MSERTVICFHERFKQYDLGEGHPFRGDRFANALEFLKKQNLLNRPDITIPHPKPASREDLLRAHSAEYVNLVSALAEKRENYDIETPVSHTILEAALLICGSSIQAGIEVLEGRAARAISIGGGFHHAGRNYGGGFCLFNDVAVLIEYLRAKFKVRRFLVLDYDVHFGNGTSDIYCKDPSVLYISLHQDPRTIYPGTGFVWQIGEEGGEGFNVNVPLPIGTGDDTYSYALKETFVLLAEEFKPDIIIANGGSDAHFADSLGSLALTSNGFFQLSKLIRATAEEICEGKLVLIPGSGYNPQVLPRCWYALVAGVVGLKSIDVEEQQTVAIEPTGVRRAVEKTLDDLKRHLRRYWTCFDGFRFSGVQ